MNTKISICNNALIRIGAKTIQNIDNDGSKEALMCRYLYNETLEQLLSSHRWNFAMQTKPLNMLKRKDKYSDYPFTYQLPPDCLLVVDVYPCSQSRIKSGNYGAKNYNLAKGNVETDYPGAVIKYISRIDDNVRMPAYFREVLVLQLALKLSVALTDNTRMYSQLYHEVAEAVQKAKIIDTGQKGAEYIDLTNPLSNARCGGDRWL